MCQLRAEQAGWTPASQLPRRSTAGPPGRTALPGLGRGARTWTAGGDHEQRAPTPFFRPPVTVCTLAPSSRGGGNDPWWRCCRVPPPERRAEQPRLAAGAGGRNEHMEQHAKPRPLQAPPRRECSPSSSTAVSVARVSFGQAAVRLPRGTPNPRWVQLLAGRRREAAVKDVANDSERNSYIDSCESCSISLMAVSSAEREPIRLRGSPSSGGPNTI